MAMRRLQDISIKYKLTAIVLTTCTISLLVALVIFVHFERITMKNTMTRNLHILAQIIGFNSTAAITFNSEDDANEVLAALKAEPHIISACIYTLDGRQFARYARDANTGIYFPDSPQIRGYQFSKDGLSLFEDILLNTRSIGTIYLESDLQELSARMRSHISIVILAFLSSTLVAFFVITRLQKVVSRPINHLADVARHVSISRDYSIRAVEYGKDEVGFLITKFNEMLTYIQQRDAALQDAHSGLEQRVKERTLELENEIEGHKKAKKALQESERRFQDVALSSADWIWEVDQNGVYNFASGKVKEILEYEPHELIGKTPFELMPPSEAERVGKLFGEIISQKKPIVDLENWNLTKSGKKVCLLTNGVPLIDDNGILLGYRGVDKDITQSKIDEEHRRDLQEKLERAQRMESLGVLAGGVAHDLNNMLGPLVGYPELMLMQLPEDSPLRKQVQKMANSAEGAAEVVQDLLTLARRGRYNMVKTDMNKVVESYLETPSFDKLQNDNPEIQLSLKLSDHMPSISGSTPHLNKVVMNLVVNAFDAMPNGGEICIETEVLHITELLGGHDKIDEGDYVLLKVRDTGSGISPEDLGKIFEPYFSKKEMGASGSGLGLSVVYGVVKDHHGYYDILSTPGKGTEFIMYFPKTSKSDHVPDLQTNSDGSARGKETVLVVDDNIEQREMAAELLDSLGYIVATVENGHKALEYLESQTVDIVTLDMIMEEGFDGLDTYTEIIKNNPEQKAIIISGFSATDRVQKMQELGAGQYVKKPYTRDTLGQAIRTELDYKSPKDLKSQIVV